MLDFVSIAMVFILPILTWSLFVVRAQKNYALHRRIQITTGCVLLVAVLLFEIDVRVNGWRHLAKPSPFYDTWLFPFLYVHLFCAVSAALTWTYTLTFAIKRKPTPATMLAQRHRRNGWISVVFMYLTSITGWVFYWMAFVAT